MMITVGSSIKINVNLVPDVNSNTAATIVMEWVMAHLIV